MIKLKTGMIFFATFVFGTAANALDKSSLTVVTHADWPGFTKTADALTPLFQQGGYSNTPLIFNTKEPVKNRTPGIPLEVIQKEVANMMGDGKKDSILYLLDHAWFDDKNPRHPGTPQTGMYISGEKGKPYVRLYMSNLAEDIKKIKPAEKRLRLIGDFCYGNSVHEVSIANKNTCSLGMGDVEISYVGMESNETSKAMISNITDKKNDFNKNGKASLLESYLLLALNNVSYSDFGAPGKDNLYSMSLSSMHYAQLLTGKPNSFARHENKDDQGLEGTLQELQAAMFACKEIDSNNVTGLTDAEVSQLRGVKAKCELCTRAESTQADVLKKLDPILEALKKDGPTYRLSPAEWEKLPLDYQNAFKLILENAKKNFAGDQVIIEKMLGQIKGLRTKWNQLSDEYQSCIEEKTKDCSKSKLQLELLETNGKIRAEIAKIRDKISFFRKPYFILQKFKVLAKALSEAKPNEVAKLKELMACEQDGM